MSAARDEYWQAVASLLSHDHGLKRRRGLNLCPETIERLAEGNGILRRNIPEPTHMARAVSRFFAPRET